MFTLAAPWHQEHRTPLLLPSVLEEIQTTELGYSQQDIAYSGMSCFILL